MNNRFLRLMEKIENMKIIHILLIFVIIAVFFSEIFILIQSLLLTGGIDKNLIIVGFVTPIIDGFIVVLLLLLVLNRSKLLKNLIGQSRDEIFVIDARKGQLIYLNNSACEKLGYNAGQYRELHIFDIESAIENGKVWNEYINAVKIKKTITFESEHTKKNGVRYPVEVSLNMNDQYEGKYLISVTRDLTERKKFEQELKKLAITDPLTGIDNRQAFNKTMDLEIKRAKRYRESLSLIMFDIDFFKSINDRFGHGAGDMVLKGIAEVGEKCKRDVDHISRWGGEEFMLLTPNTAGPNAVKLAERLRKIIQGHNFATIGTVTASFGVTQWTEADSAETFQKRVDEALYRAKRKGRNCVIIV